MWLSCLVLGNILKRQEKALSRLLILIGGRGRGGGLCDRGSGTGFKINTCKRRGIYNYTKLLSN